MFYTGFTVKPRPVAVQLPQHMAQSYPDFFSVTTPILTNCTIYSHERDPRRSTGPEVIKLLSCSSKLSIKFIMLINVKMLTIVGILTFISMINATSERLKARNFFFFGILVFYEQLKFRAQLS